MQPQRADFRSLANVRPPRTVRVRCSVLIVHYTAVPGSLSALESDHARPLQLLQRPR